MPFSTSDRRPPLSIIAIVLGILAVAAATASFFTDATWELRAVALVLIILGLALARVAGRPPVDGGRER